MTDVGPAGPSSTSTSSSSSPCRSCWPSGSTWSTPCHVARLAGRARAGRRPGRPRQPRDPGGLDPHHHGHRARSWPASAPTSWSSPAGRAAARARARSGRRRRKTILPVQVIGQQWKFTYRYPTFGGFETDQLVLPDDTTIAVQRHVARRDPQLLGLPARGEGRRQPGLQQRGLRHHRTNWARSPSAAPSSAASGTGPCTTTAQVVTQAAVRRLGHGSPQLRLHAQHQAAPAVRLPTRPTPTAPTAATTPTTWTPTPTSRQYGAAQPKGGS